MVKLGFSGARQTETPVVLKDRGAARVVVPRVSKSPNSCLGQQSPHLARKGHLEGEGKQWKQKKST